MCRLMAYMGPKILVADVVLWPDRSIMKQSYDAKERKNNAHPAHLAYGNLNGDGFGIGWYSPDSATPDEVKEDPTPCVFTSVTPAWCAAPASGPACPLRKASKAQGTRARTCTHPGTHAGTCTRACGPTDTRTHAHTHAPCKHAHTHMRSPHPLTHSHARVRVRARTHSQAGAHAHAAPHALAHTYTPCAHARRNALTPTCTHMRSLRPPTYSHARSHSCADTRMYGRTHQGRVTEELCLRICMVADRCLLASSSKLVLDWMVT